MKTNLIRIFSYVALISTAQANWQPYIGAGIGVSKSQNVLKAKYSSVIGAGNTTINMGATGSCQSLLLGLRKQYNSFFLGGELFTTLHQLKKTKKDVDYFDKFGPLITLNFQFKQKYSNGFSCFIGTNLTQCLDIFLKLDLFMSKFSLHYANPEENTSGRQSKQVFGYAPGIAVQSKVTECIGIRLDYSYKIYNTFKTKNISRETLVANTSITGKLTPRIHQFMLSLIYSF